MRAKGETKVEQSSKITTPPMPSALREHLNTYHQRRARARRRAGETVEPGEFRGAGRFILELIAWSARLCESDIEKISREGRADLEQLEALGSDYEGPLPYEPNSESILAPERRGSGADTIGDVPVRHIGGTRERLHRRGGGQAAGQQEAGGRGRKDPAVAAGKP